MAFKRCSRCLSVGAIEALEHHGSKDKQAKYLPDPRQRALAGTMTLTEPCRRSDVGALALDLPNRSPDGRYAGKVQDHRPEDLHHLGRA